MTSAPRLRTAGGAVAAACLAVTMLLGAGGAASAAPAPAAPVKTLSGVGPGGTIYHDFEPLASGTASSYSFDRYQWFEVARSAQWSRKANAVYVDVQPKSFSYWSGLWWNGNQGYPARVTTTATLIKIGPDGGEIDTLRVSEVTRSDRGGSLTGHLALDKGGEGSYCVRLESQVTGLLWDRYSSNLSNSRSFCFYR